MPAKKPEPLASNLNREDIERLIDVIHEKQIEEFELEQGGMRVRIVSHHRKGAAASGNHQPVELSGEMLPEPAPAPAPATSVTGTSSTPKTGGAGAEDDPRLHKVVSPMVGTFYRSAAPGSKSYVEIGDKVDDDSVLCIIEAMKLMNEIKAECRGVVKKIVVENGQPVEYGQVLFLIDPA